MQFEVCAAYIQSLRSLGYEVVADRFDDEGYSGATLNRPARMRASLSYSPSSPYASTINAKIRVDVLHWMSSVARSRCH